MKLTLKEFTERVGQTKAAQMLGMRQSAISKAISAGRNIYVQILSNGSVLAEETKQFPAKPRVGRGLPGADHAA